MYQFENSMSNWEAQEGRRARGSNGMSLSKVKARELFLRWFEAHIPHTQKKKRNKKKTKTVFTRRDQKPRPSQTQPKSYNLQLSSPSRGGRSQPPTSVGPIQGRSEKNVGNRRSGVKARRIPRQKRRAAMRTKSRRKEGGAEPPLHVGFGEARRESHQTAKSHRG